MKKNINLDKDLTYGSEISPALVDFLLENASDAIYLYDRAGLIHYANKTAEIALGYSKTELLGKNIGDLDSSFSESDNFTFWDQSESKAFQPLQTLHTKKDGSSVPVEIVASSSVSQQQVYAVAFVRDITERIQSQQALREGEEKFSVIADLSPVAHVISKKSDGTIIYVNRQAETLFGKHQGQLEQENIGSLFEASGADADILEALSSCREIQNQELLLRFAHEGSAWVSLNSRMITLDGEEVLCITMMDVTEAHELSNQLTYQATYDDLTGLVNRREFEDRLQQVIESAQEKKTINALCYLDLDQFKIINDTCGHMAGDELLRQLAKVLFQTIRRDDTLARLGGDEFALLLEDCTLESAERVAENVRRVVESFRFHWQNNTFNLSVSIGLTPIDIEGGSLTDILRRADSACYAAKDAGRNRIHVFEFDDEELAQRHGEMKWVMAINAALDEDRLQLWQQEIACISQHDENTGEAPLRHFEILVRMLDEDGGIILPGVFLPIAERYDLAPKIDRWVVKETFKWFSQNPQQLDRLGVCSINLSGQSLSDENFLSEIIEYIDNSIMPANKICFEITETAAITNLTYATQFMQALKQQGCTFALDDFGSGLSSFAYLKNLPVDYVKIDGFFVKDILSDPVDFAMVTAINSMAHAMGKLTIAEFVENDEILQKLVGLGIDFVQGYGISKPVPLSADSGEGVIDK